MRRILLPLLLVVAFASSARAQTLTVRDIVELTKAGLGEQALLALIDVHKSVFPVDKDTLKSLKADGVSDNVIVAMIRSGRDLVPPPPPEPLTPSVIVDRGDGSQPLVVRDRADRDETNVIVVEQPEPRRRREEPLVREVERVREVAVPVYVPVPTRRVDRDDDRGDPPKKAEPVYWGYDGKLRPDAWGTRPPEKKPDPKDPKKND